jgi:GntR family transcriptional repressor for pyruvate dehydrogenase complex
MQEPRVAYLDVADHIRELIIAGTVKVGERLPSEAELCSQLGVSRSTLREALRILSSQKVIRTKRGVGGGTIVAAMTHGDVSEMLGNNLDMLARSEGCTVAELVEARELIEVPAARLAALRRSDEQLAKLRKSIPSTLANVNPRRIFEVNHIFHEIVLEMAGNRLLNVLTQPIFTVLSTRFLRDRATMSFWKEVMAQHALIADRIQARDGEGAAMQMMEHVEGLRVTYESIDAAGATELLLALGSHSGAAVTAAP